MTDLVPVLDIDRRHAADERRRELRLIGTAHWKTGGRSNEDIEADRIMAGADDTAERVQKFARFRVELTTRPDGDVEEVVREARSYLADAMRQPGESYPPVFATYVEEGVPSASAKVSVDTALVAIAFAILHARKSHGQSPPEVATGLHSLRNADSRERPAPISEREGHGCSDCGLLSCVCFDDEPYDPDEDDGWDECGMMPDGGCMLAGTEWCDWDCPRNRPVSPALSRHQDQGHD